MDLKLLFYYLHYYYYKWFSELDDCLKIIAIMYFIIKNTIKKINSLKKII